MIATCAFSLWTGADAFAGSCDAGFVDNAIVAVSLAAKWFPHVVLVTDTRGADIMAGLGLPFTEVSTALDAVPVRLSFLYSVGKLYGYRHLAARGSPFLSTDLDFFLWRKPDDALMEAPQLSQHRFPMPPALAEFCRKTWPEGMKPPPESCCSGAIGGNDVPALAAYAERAIELANLPSSEAPMRVALKGKTPWLGPCSVEEAVFAKMFPTHPGFLPPHHPSDAEWVASGVGHLNGTLKQDPMNRERIRRVAELAFPDLYETSLSHCLKSSTLKG